MEAGNFLAGRGRARGPIGRCRRSGDRRISRRPAGSARQGPMALRIAFFGLPLAALLLARDGHDVALAALSRTDAVGLRRARRLFGPDRLLIKPKVSDPELLARVRG